MRVLLFTGKGGVGKTTTAAATAALAASRGLKALVLSTDPAHSLSDALDVSVADRPTEVDTGLYAMQVDTQAAFERSWAGVQDYLRAVLAKGGADPFSAEELTVLPGAEEVLALLELRAQVASGRWDLVVVDCAPTGETLRLLALPEALQWYADKIFPAQRRALRAAGPLLARRASIPLPTEGVLEAVGRLHGELTAVRALLSAETTSVRLVLTPEAVVVAEARRTLTALALYGYAVDEVIANRVFPPSSDEFLTGWVRSQAEQLAAVRRDVGDLVVREQPYRPGEPVGLAALTELGQALYGEDDPAARPPRPEDLLSIDRDGEAFVLSMRLPLARREDLDLARAGDDLVLTVAGKRRLVTLPSVLTRCRVAGAALSGGRLHVRFLPDPRLWPDALKGGL